MIKVPYECNSEPLLANAVRQKQAFASANMSCSLAIGRFWKEGTFVPFVPGGGRLEVVEGTHSQKKETKGKKNDNEA
jgi:hypothetical protein